jgi:HEAT repeat protein
MLANGGVKMPITMEEVRAVLNPDEPDYTAAATLGSDAIPHLLALASGADVSLASKATYLASLIDTEGSIDVLREAAASNHPEVRVAAAWGAQNIRTSDVGDVLLSLVTDQDYGVRRVALLAMPSELSSELRNSLRDISENESEPSDLRAIASQALEDSRTITNSGTDKGTSKPDR